VIEFDMLAEDSVALAEDRLAKEDWDLAVAEAKTVVGNYAADWETGLKEAVEVEEEGKVHHSNSNSAEASMVADAARGHKVCPSPGTAAAVALDRLRLESYSLRHTMELDVLVVVVEGDIDPALDEDVHELDKAVHQRERRE
jgi:hypothetical protein